MKKVGIIGILLLSIGLIIYKIDKVSNNKPLIENKTNENKILAYYIEDKEGNYQEVEDNSWNKYGYKLNKDLSYCENGSTISWNEKTEKINLKIDKSDRCYIYFDFDDENYIRDLSGNNNHGKYENIVSLTSEGITTSDETKSGYVDCGLAGYNFNNTVSIITRVKWNKLKEAHYSALLGNLGYVNSRHGFAFAMDNNINDNRYKPYIAIINSSSYEKAAGKKNKIEINKWHTLIGIYDGTVITFCINENCDSYSVSNWLSTSDFPIFLGGYPNDIQDEKFIKSNDYDYNTFSDLLIYDRAITEEEKNSFATDINPKNKEDLILWYKFSK